jgi:methionine-rich copper-binding protein CopC
MFTRRYTYLSALLVVAVGLGAQPAWAHAFLAHAEPRVGSTVHGAPSAVTVTFTEPIEASFSRLEVFDAKGQRIDSAPVEHPKPEELRVPLPAVPPGDYTVHWAVTSVDTHQTEGRFDFTVVAP